jgi:uncharacterized phiE125 gp8 family phage protein
VGEEALAMSRAWDDGVRWHLEQVTPPDMSLDALTVEFVRSQHLRAASDGEDDPFIERLLSTSYRSSERITWRAHLTQAWALVMDRFPSCQIVLPKPPLQSVTSITYIDEDGAEQELLGSPSGTEFTVLAPSGPKAAKGSITPLYDEVWPTTRAVPDAVRVEFVCGYTTVPEDIDHGRLVMMGEMYKQRSLSVHAMNQNPALIQARDIWLNYRAY